MPACLSFKSSTSSSASAPVPNLPPPPSQGNSTEDTPTFNISHEYNLTMQANSYNEIWSIIQAPPQDQQVHHLLAQLLHPDREHIQQALTNANNTTLTRLISTYFDHSESTSELCLHLHQCVHRARTMYAPLLDLLSILPHDSNHVTQSHCDNAFDLFLVFDSKENPFPSPDEHNFSNIRSCFSELKQQLDARLRKSQSRIRLLRRATAGSTLCLVATAVGVAVAAVVVTVHAIVGFAAAAAAAAAAAPLCSAYYIPNPEATEKRELARLKQLDAAAKGTYVLNNDLDTIDRLVARLHTAVEGDKLLVRLGLERGRNRYPIQEVLKQLSKNHQNFLHQLEDLEEHICLWFYTVNKARSLLLQEICHHQTS